MARTVFKLESKYVQFLTDRELEILKNDKNCNKHLTYKEDMTLIGAIANTILDGRTVEEFISELESKLAAFNAKYSCEKDLSVRIVNDRLYIKFAYNEALKNELKKALNAKWHAESKEWSVSLENEIAANEIVKKHLDKGFLKEEKEMTETENDVATSTMTRVEENKAYTCEEIAHKFDSVFLVDPYHIMHLLKSKYYEGIKCTVDNKQALIYDLGDIALLDFPRGIKPEGANIFKKPDIDLNDKYNKKALKLYGKSESVNDELLMAYIEDLKKL
jgi:hypothetical protein